MLSKRAKPRADAKQIADHAKATAKSIVSFLEKYEPTDPTGQVGYQEERTIALYRQQLMSALARLGYHI